MSDVEGDAVSSSDQSKKRKRRPRLNCEECRRLKLKCDRKVPCDNCIKRHCSSICPDGARPGVRKSISGREEGAQDDRRESTTSDGSNVPNNQTVQNQQNQQRSPLASQTAFRGTTLAQQGHAVRPSTDVFMAPAEPQVRHTGGGGPIPSTISPGIAGRGGLSSLPEGSNNATSGSFSTDAGRPDLADEQSHGTLVISHTGSSKYLGSSAASEWLKDQEVEDMRETPDVSRASSPPFGVHSHDRHNTLNILGSRNQPTMAELMLSLPNPEEAEVLIDCYYRYFGWSYEIIARRALQTIFDKVYDVLTGGQLDRKAKRAHAQQLALLFIVLAMGALHNLELPPDDPSASDYAALARDSLNEGDFMVNNTIAGVQTLAVMAHYHLETDRGRNGDSAWPLWGLAMRIMQAMGLHRDGQRWNLANEVVEERRRVFWEVHSAEIFQANCFGRPCSLPAEFIDTQFPARTGRSADAHPGYDVLKFQLCQLSKEILYLALTVNGPSPIAAAKDLYDRLCQFERSMPFALRCRAALLALPSLYSDPSQAEADSPVPNKRHLRRTFEQHHLALMISEAIVNLYRPQFMRALNQSPSSPLSSDFGQPFLVVVERSNVIIRIVCELYSMFPSVTGRHWWCWYHAFNSAVCLGTFVLMSPLNNLAPVALSSMDQVITIYTSIIQTRASARFVQNLQWLLRLRQRASNRMAQPLLPASIGGSEEDADLDAGLLGWRTRFIERANRGGQKATTISESPTAIDWMNNLNGTTGIDHVIHSLPQAVQDHIISNDGIPSNDSGPGTTPSQSNATDYFLHEFWDPLMMLQDEPGEHENPMTWGDILSQVEGNNDG